MKFVPKSILTSSLRMAALFSLAVVLPANAEGLRASVPFGFEAAGIAMPAGEYQIRIDRQAHQATFLNSGGETHRVFIATDGVNPANAEAGMLKFYRTGDTWQLREMKSPGTATRHTLPSRRTNDTAGMPIAMIRVW